jgi:phage FluMu gp28-like protein
VSKLRQSVHAPEPGGTPASSIPAAPKIRKRRRQAKSGKAKSPKKTSAAETPPPQNVDAPDFRENAWATSPSVFLLPPEPKARRRRKKLPALEKVSIDAALVGFREYQLPVFLDRESGILVLHWSRQIGKSHTLSYWAGDRLLKQLKKYDTWLVTVLSNSRDNGAEFALKAQEYFRKVGQALEVADFSSDLNYENMRFEIRLDMTYEGRERHGRIKVLAANPRTARGFSGDLILDEFAFHEDSAAIWEAAEPILSSNAEFRCRVASTGNGKHNLFYRLAAGEGPNDGTPFQSASGFKVCRVTRTEAHRMGVTVFDPNTRQPITPPQARAKALDKRAYDQNYECLFHDESMALLTHALISAAERSPVPVEDQAWSRESLARMIDAQGDLCAGLDIGRTRDLSVLCVLERLGNTKRVIGMLRMAGMRFPAQQEQVDLVCGLPKFRSLQIDMTGLGVGLVEYLQETHGSYGVHGVNFSNTEPLSARLLAEGRKAETARVTEIMAMDLLGCFEDRSLEIPLDRDLHDDLAKPEKITSPSGRVSIAATRDDAGHADHFWSLALAVRACAQGYQAPGSAGTVKVEGRETVGYFMCARKSNFRFC